MTSPQVHFSTDVTADGCKNSPVQTFVSDPEDCDELPPPPGHHADIQAGQRSVISPRPAPRKNCLQNPEVQV